MNILVDIGHPGHVHLFKNFIWEMKKRNNKIVVTTKNQPSINYLLDKYKIDYINIGKKKNSLFLKALSQILFEYRLYKIAKKEKVDLAVGTSISIAHASKFLKFKSLVFNEDDARAVPYFSKITYPFSDYIITPDCLRYEKHGKKHVIHNSLHELAYLHPNNFRPDPNIPKELGVRNNEKYFIIRFNAFKAHHDNRVRGILKKNELIELLKKNGKVFITTEGKIDEEYKQFQIRIPPEKMHSALSHATIFIGESQTMTAEAAVLGTPAIRCNSFVGQLAYLEELEHKYGLTYGFRPEDEDKMFLKIEELLNKCDLKEEWQKRRQRLLEDKIDLTGWMIKFIDTLI